LAGLNQHFVTTTAIRKAAKGCTCSRNFATIGAYFFRRLAKSCLKSIQFITVSKT
jgi:peptide chain release factor 2